MIELRHIGFYVKNMEKMVCFYENTFEMERICYNQPDSNSLLDELFGIEDIKIATTKLITQRGQKCGTGDMIELVKVIDWDQGRNLTGCIFDSGVVHMAMGVDDIEKIYEKAINNGGEMGTSICQHENGNRFAFIKDPEGNWIEIIQRKDI